MTIPESFAEYLGQLSENLPDMDFDASNLFSSDREFLKEDMYLSYYGIDFHRQLPGVCYRMGGVDVADFRVACQCWMPASEARGTLVVLHGYFDHVGIYGHLIRYLLEKNYAVVAFDLPGHGLSSGERVAIDTFFNYVDVFVELLGHLEGMPKPLHAVGQSTGCAVLLKGLLTNSANMQRLDKVVLLAPLIKPRGWMVGQFTYLLLRKFKRTVRRKFVKTCANKEFLEFIAHHDPLQSQHLSVAWVGAMKQWIDLFPTLPKLDREITIVQGDKDETVAWQYNTEAIVEKISGTSLTIIPGAGHHLVNEIDGIRNQVFSAMPL